ncbi:MAG: amino acid ABC transporter permease [Rhodoferax sp.]|nr:amino acid ABC transporter permease [Rhodoferax sp.]
MPDAPTSQPVGGLPTPAARPAARKRRAWGWLDAVLLAGFAGMLVYLGWMSSTVFSYDWDWSSIWPFIVRYDEASGAWVSNLLVEGLLTTLRLAVWGILIAGVIGTLMGLCRNSKRLFLRLIGGSYVMLIRNIPPVVFVFVFVYFIASQIMPKLALADSVAGLSSGAQWWVGVFFGTPRLIDNFMLGLICLSVFSGAYVTEIVRAGLQSVPRSQVEAGKSLGLSRVDILRFVVLPQAFRNVLPPMAGQFIQLIKDSSLVSLVSIQELTFMAQDVQVTTQRVFEVFVFIAAVYFVICFSLSRLFAMLERRYARAHH